MIGSWSSWLVERRGFVSGRAMMTALIAGERDPKALAQLARTTLRRKITQLQEAFTGHFTDHHAFLLGIMLTRVDAISTDIADLDAMIEEMIAPFVAAVDRLVEISGIGHISAAITVSEIGVDMSRFPTAAHLASWAKFASGVKESAGKKKGKGSTGHGNRYLARVLMALSTHCPPPRQEESHRRDRPLLAGHHLAPAQRPRARWI